MFLQLLDRIVRDGGLPVLEEGVPDSASADGSGLCGPALVGNEGPYSGGDQLHVGVVAYRPVDILHHDVAEAARMKCEVDTGDPHDGVGLVDGLARRSSASGPHPWK
jgi:hypothetical protein